jgi:hypothetical protein
MDQRCAEQPTNMRQGKERIRIKDVRECGHLQRLGCSRGKMWGLLEIR